MRVQIRRLIMLAKMFNRVVVFDKLYASAAKFWHQHNGRIWENPNMTLPYEAPLDNLV